MSSRAVTSYNNFKVNSMDSKFIMFDTTINANWDLVKMYDSCQSYYSYKIKINYKYSFLIDLFL